MGNNKPPVVERKRRGKKKKGRPSLLDIQKRSLRLQKQEEVKINPNPSPSPEPNSRRRITRRNPNTDTSAASSSDDDEEASNGRRRREKKLKLVLRLPTDDADQDNKAEGNKSSKGTDSQQEDALDSGPTTPLPDKKLLVFILDRLQKKDTYGVYSEPVDPEELPDYHDIIEHPMDFGTVRKKLSSGQYASLEQFEKDVFLISSNAMRYNAPDTIYFRQARAIQELAKKSFENLRQESDDNNETEEKTEKTIARRGRPPSKNKKPLGRPQTDNINNDINTINTNAAPDFSLDTRQTNNADTNQWSLTYDISKRVLLGEKPRNDHAFNWLNEQKSERNEELQPGSGLKGMSTKFGKKPVVVDENRRKTYKQSQISTSVQESPILSISEGQRKLLVPVGIQVEHAYVRSLARFAAKLGPVGWAVASKRIERVLPPGTKFGPGWVIDSQSPIKSQIKTPDKIQSPNQNSIEEAHVNRTQPTASTSNNESGGNQMKAPMHSHQINGFINPSSHNNAAPPPNLAKMVRPHSQAFDAVVSRSNSGNQMFRADERREILLGNSNQVMWQGLSAQPKPDLTPPDLNVGFQSMGSLGSGSSSRADSQHPDLALQL